MQTIKFNGHNDYLLHVHIWDKVESPRAVVQIAHGMAEHSFRYDEFAKVLNKKGYIVIADDHRGHGITAGESLGICPSADCFNDTVEDMILLTDFADKTYNLPIVLFGHSYGSFLAQAYIQKAGDKIAAVVLSGSAKQDTLDRDLGYIVSKIQFSLFGGNKPAKLIDKLSFGKYDKKFKSEKQKGAWLCSDKNEVVKYLNDPMSGQIMSIGFYKSFFSALKKLYKQSNIDKIRKDLPILIVSGDKDCVGGAGKLVKNLYDTYAEASIKNVKMKIYPNLRHELTNEKNKHEVFNDVIDFLDTNS